MRKDAWAMACTTIDRERDESSSHINKLELSGRNQLNEIKDSRDRIRLAYSPASLQSGVIKKYGREEKPRQTRER
jgi:hypothetical protein